MSKILLHTLDRYEIREKVGWFTADNASNNDTTLVSLAEDLNIDDETPYWDPVEHRHFISDVSPMSAKAVLAKVKKMKARLLKDNPDLDLDELNELLQDDEAEEDENEADADEFAAGDAVGKGLALINQILKSPQAQAYFAKTCKTLEIPALQLIGWIRTRWASLYAFLDRILLLQKAVNQFANSADESDEVPDLDGKCYMDFKLGKSDWLKIQKVHEVLQCWIDMAALPKFADMAPSIEAGLENIAKWYRKTDDTDVYFICLGTLNLPIASLV
ncbi:hypothetical protein FB451DRAFT_1186706 [Mycena latifolia]|nr:hypothetical protein FB451DRAFT_1186706 [Mycena latifolia]